MLILTKKVEYALLALTYLARNETRSSSAREIADQYRVPLPLLMNLLKRLTQQGLVHSTRGARGGYVLASPAGEITLEALIRAIEGPVSITQCAAPGEGVFKKTCGVGAPCPVTSAVRNLNKRFRSLLAGVTLADIVRDDAALTEGPDALAVAETRQTGVV